MARKTLCYEVKDEGRDKGKIFIITEMPASQAEKWAMRALLGMSSNGVDIPDEAIFMGMASLVSLGLNMLGKLPYAEAIVLFDEMMACVQIQPNPKQPEIVRALVEDDIEEIKTRLKLRAAVINLHVDFFKAVGLLTTASDTQETSPAA